MGGGGGGIQYQDVCDGPRETTEREKHQRLLQSLIPYYQNMRVTGTSVSIKTTNTQLNKLGLISRWLFLTRVHHQLCLQWCQANSTWNLIDWSRIDLNIESFFELSPGDQRRRPRMMGHPSPANKQDVISFDSKTPPPPHLAKLLDNPTDIISTAQNCFPTPKTSKF